MDDQQPRRRRIDRVTAPDYLDGLSQRSAAEVRTMRDECREEEARLSYARRLLQGRLDIVRAELARRRQGEDATGLVDALASILADEPPARSRVLRNAPLYNPEEADARRRDDAQLGDPALGRLPELDDAEAAALAERLASDEREISDLRRTVLAHLDRLQQELIARYRDGAVALDDIVSSVAGQAASREDPDDR